MSVARTPTAVRRPQHDVNTRVRIVVDVILGINPGRTLVYIPQRMEDPSVQSSEQRPVASSIERILGGWQFIWYDYEDHGPLLSATPERYEPGRGQTAAAGAKVQLQQAQSVSGTLPAIEAPFPRSDHA